MLREIDLQHPAAKPCVRYICQNLRAEDRREVAATPNDDLSLEQGFLKQGKGLVVTTDHEPAALLWWLDMGRGTCLVAMLATPAWPSVGRAVTKTVLKKLIPTLRADGMKQALCICEASNRQARDWLERVGFNPTTRLPNRGKQNEEFILYTYDF